MEMGKREGGTDKIPASGLSSISQLVVGGENEEDFWCHSEVIQRVAGRGLISPDRKRESFLLSVLQSIMKQLNLAYTNQWYLGVVYVLN